MTLRTIALALGVSFGLGLEAGAALAQDLGSMEVRVGGEDRTLLIREEAEGETSGVAPAEETGVRVVTLVATPVAPSVEADGEAGEADEGGQDAERLSLVFEIEGGGSDVLTSDPLIDYRDATGRAFGMREGLSGVVTVSGLSEIGSTLIISGDFSAELVPEGGDDILGVSGSFQMTVEDG